MSELDLFKILLTAVCFSLAFFCLFIKAPKEGFVKNFQSVSKTLIFLAVFNLLLWVDKLYMVFLASEFLFLLFLWRPGEKLNLAYGLRGILLFFISFLGCILISGSFVVYSGAGVNLLLSDLKAVAVDLYAVNYLYSIGLVFLIVPLFYRLGVLQFIRRGQLFRQSYSDFILFKSAAVLTLFKYSGAGLFLASLKMQIFIQWALVFSILFLAISSFSESNFSKKITKWMEVNILLVVASGLGFVFDAEGSLEASFYLFTQSAFYFFVLSLTAAYFIKFKGAELSDLDFKGLNFKAPRLTFILTVGLFSLCSFPLLLTFYTRVLALKMTVQTGFYWVSFWSLFASLLCWFSAAQFVMSFYMDKFDVANWSLWDQKSLKDVGVYKASAAVLMLLLLPIVVFYLPVNL